VQTRMLGQLEVSLVGVGGNNFGRRLDADGTRAVVDAALDAGVNLFDTSDSYGDGSSEELLGRALGRRRGEALVATKFGSVMGGDPEKSGARPEYVRAACEASLGRLGIDVIDLYQLHRPDPDTPLEETLGALHELVLEGKVREIGCSNFSPAQIEQSRRSSDERGITAFASVQNHWSLLHREPEENGVIDACRAHGMGVLPYFPLAAGMLTGKYTRGAPPPPGTRLGETPARAQRYLNDHNFAIVDQLQDFARQRGHTLLELAIGWLAAAPVTASVIAGATKPEQVRANAGALGWELTEAERQEVDTLTANARIA